MSDLEDEASKKRSSRSTLQGKIFFLELYLDNAQHLEILSELRNGFMWEWVGILHDSDKYLEDSEEHKAGDFKKPHWHILINMCSRRTIKGVGRIFRLEENLIQIAFDKRQCALYLTHRNAPEKHQYKTDELRGSIDFYKTCLNSQTVKEEIEEQAIKDLLLYAHKNPFCTYSQLLEFALDNHIYAEFRKSGYVLNVLINEGKRGK